MLRDVHSGVHRSSFQLDKNEEGSNKLVASSVVRRIQRGQSFQQIEPSGRQTAEISNKTGVSV